MRPPDHPPPYERRVPRDQRGVRKWNGITCEQVVADLEQPRLTSVDAVEGDLAGALLAAIAANALPLLEFTYFNVSDQ